MTSAEQASFTRIERLAGRSIAESWADWSRDCARPLEALHRLERWLGQLSSPGLMLDHWVAVPSLARLAVALLGASHHIADIVAQNPETGAILTDPAELVRPRTVRELIDEAEKLVAHSVSYSHRLDRLRFLKQRETLRLAAMDLARLVDEPSIWSGISDLAISVVSVLRRVVWDQHREGKDLAAECPISVVAFGKLGGGELNYSSDIDLVFVLDEGLDEDMTRHAARACELLRAALADKMGRGDLYRVDLRLRPFGSQGPIASPLSVYRSYYQKYAEPWEHLALLRSRVIAGPSDVQDEWEAMRSAVVFNSVRSDMTLEALVHMRARIEEIGSPNDLKRRAGGIRDIEFLVQTIQMVFGRQVPECQVRPTLAAIENLCNAGFLDQVACASLSSAYTFYRQTEHRCQIVGNLQTHDVPTEPAALEALAHTLRFGSAAEFTSELDRHTTEVRSLYNRLMPGARQKAAEANIEPAVERWINSLPGKEQIWASLTENQDSLERIQRLAKIAPDMVPQLANSPVVTEAIVSGEIFEEPQSLNLTGLRSHPPSLKAVRSAMDSRLRRISRWCLGEGPRLGVSLTDRDDQIIVQLLENSGLDVVALGSSASRDTSISSDVDLILMCPDAMNWGEAESLAQEFLSVIQALRAAGDPLTIDVRLRPEGKKGSLVVTDEGFRRYEAGAMELWERFALGRSRLIYGRPAALKAIRHAAYGRSYSPDDFAALAEMKRRIESERVSVSERSRHLKLGKGGVDDINWAIQILLMSVPGVALACASAELAPRSEALVASGALSLEDAETLLDAHQFLSDLRAYVSLLGLPGDVLPENPAHLDRLAESFGLSSGPELLDRYAHLSSRVREILNAIWRRVAIRES